MSDEYDVLKILARVLKLLGKKYNSPPHQTGVQKYPSGVISVDVHGKPMFWLFDEYELSEWLRDKLEELENDNKDE
jgi:hypothetical protein